MYLWTDIINKLYTDNENTYVAIDNPQFAKKELAFLHMFYQLQVNFTIHVHSFDTFLISWENIASTSPIITINLPIIICGACLKYVIKRIAPF